MDTRALFVATLLLATAIAFVPSASAKPCDASSGIDCDASTGNCDVSAGADVITTTAAGASADCTHNRMRCYTAVGVGQDLFDPTIEHWCAV